MCNSGAIEGLRSLRAGGVGSRLNQECWASEGRDRRLSSGRELVCPCSPRWLGDAHLPWGGDLSFTQFMDSSALFFQRCPHRLTQKSCFASHLGTLSNCYIELPCALRSVQFSSVTPGLPVHHQLPEFTQTHLHRVSDAIQPSHPLSSRSPPALNLSQHQSLFK